MDIMADIGNDETFAGKLASAYRQRRLSRNQRQHVALSIE